MLFCVMFEILRLYYTVIVFALYIVKRTINLF